MPIFQHDNVEIAYLDQGEGNPIVLDAPDAPASKELRSIADKISGRAKSLRGRQLGLSPNRG